MGNEWRSTITRRLLAVVLALVVGITFLPLLDGQVFAKDESGSADGQQVEAPTDAEAPDVDEVLEEKEDTGGIVQNEKRKDVKESTTKGKVIANIIQEDATIQGKVLSESHGSLEGCTQAFSPRYYNVSGPDGRGMVHLTKTGKLPSPYEYAYIVVDNTYNVVKKIYSNNLDVWLDMKDYGVGYHTIGVTYRNKNSKAMYTENGTIVYDLKSEIPTYIISSPSNAIGQYEAYHNRLIYKAGNAYQYDRGCVQYIEVRPTGSGSWKRYSLGGGNSSYTIPGLSPNKRYQARVFYGKSFTYDGVDRFWTSPYSPVRTFKTGVATTPIKSFKLKAYKVKKHKVKNTNYYVGYFRTYKYKTKYVYYTYRLKAIVTFKKKPGAAGVNICGKWVKGNKKKYTVKLGGTWTSYVKPKKLKKTVSVYTYQNRSYGGYSPLYKATKKQK